MDMQEQRESLIRRWFSMWLDKQDTGIEELFAPDAVYIESWRPEYHGSGKIKLWFTEWNSRGTVEQWDIRQFFHKGAQTVVEWAFRCAMTDGTIQSFDGLSLIRWNEAGQIFCRNSASTRTATTPTPKGTPRCSGESGHCGFDGSIGMPTSRVTEYFLCPVEQVWQTITDLTNTAWRSDLA